MKQELNEYTLIEKDKNGLDLHDPGAKGDAGKIQMSFLLQFAKPLEEVAKLAAFGAEKYSREGWKYVLGGEERYTDALLRHLFKEPHETYDTDSDLLHATAVAWNALARLQFILDRVEKEEKE